LLKAVSDCYLECKLKTGIVKTAGSNVKLKLHWRTKKNILANVVAVAAPKWGLECKISGVLFYPETFCDSGASVLTPSRQS